MLPRSKRLNVPLFTEALAKGRIAHSSFFTVRILKTANSSEGISRFSVVISKKIAKTAVERNKIRRRIYSCLAKLEKQISPGFNFIFFAKQVVLKSTFNGLKEDIISFFVKNGLMK